MNKGDSSGWPGAAAVAPVPPAGNGYGAVAVAPVSPAAWAPGPVADASPPSWTTDVTATWAPNPAAAAWVGGPAPLQPVRPQGPPPPRAARSGAAAPGLWQRLRAWKPARRDLLIIGAIVVGIAVPVVVALLLMRGAAPEEQSLRFAFDSEAVNRITDGMDPSEFPADTTTTPGDQNGGGVWNFGSGGAATPGSSGSSYSGSSSGGSYSGSSSSSWSSGSSSGGGGGGGGGNTAPVPQSVVPAPMPAGSYTYGATGVVHALGQTQALTGSAAATVSGSGACSMLSIPTGKLTSRIETCTEGGALVGKARSRTMNGGTLSLGCAAPFVPAGAVGGQSWDVSCAVTLFGLRLGELGGKATLTDGGEVWSVSTNLSQGSANKWSEDVVVDKASGRIVGLRTSASLAGYTETSVFALT